MRWIFPLLGVIVFAVNTLPLAWSSLHWTMHPDLKRSWSWWANHANDVFYTTTAILIAFTSPAKVTVLNTLSRLLVVLFVFVLLPLFAAMVQGFWVVRPDSWELLRWRLNDDWQNGRALQYIVQSIYWMLATGVLWLTCGHNRLVRKASPEDTFPHEAITQQSITIQRLLALTVLAAIFAAILRWLEWSPTKWEAFQMLNGVAIALAIAGTGCFAQRLHPSHRFRDWGLGVFLIAVLWFFVSAYFVVYEHFIYATPTSTMRIFSIWDLQSLQAYQQFRGLLTDATIARILFAVFGYRLEKQGATDDLDPSSSKSDDVTNKAVGS